MNKKVLVPYKGKDSFKIKTTLGLKPFTAQICQNVGSLIPTGRFSVAQRTFVTGGAGDRFTEIASFKDFICFSVYQDLQFPFVAALLKTQ